MNRSFPLLLSSSLLLAGTAHAQLGVRAGGSLANLHTTNGANLRNSSGSLAGYQVGLTYRLPLGKVLAFVPEVQYSRERHTLRQETYAIYDVGYTADLHYRLDYLNVPLLVRATWGPVYLEAGPQVSLALAAHRDGTVYSTNWGGNSTYALDEDVAASYRRFDAGASLGVGVKLPAGLGLDVRAYRGLLTLNHEASEYQGNYQRQTIQASLTYQLPGRQ